MMPGHPPAPPPPSKDPWPLPADHGGVQRRDCGFTETTPDGKDVQSCGRIRDWRRGVLVCPAHDFLNADGMIANPATGAGR